MRLRSRALHPAHLRAPPLRHHRNPKEEAMKVRNSLKALKQQPGAQVVRRRGRVFVINNKNPRLKARQG
ncbi:hypothetical protein AHIS1636_23620 [Arthrobacter mangrovi]|uniref:Large ribosomal subunit protein bL36 n=1 Tax=Arthrobacter mangrovi TaxID=2966350 RepID=A0ABQ5MVB4_9MICC|nr:hypothetical protein AHIS1636_23620 [Arthrobacter mangrovi]